MFREQHSAELISVIFILGSGFFGKSTHLSEEAAVLCPARTGFAL